MIAAILAAGLLALDIAGVDTTYEILAPGIDDGPTVKASDSVKMHALGMVEEGQKKFWSTQDPGMRPFEYTAGVGKVIKGWDQGCLGMKLGEKRRLRIPAHEGYGNNGFPAWGIPGGATLLFEIECLEIAGTSLTNRKKKKIWVGEGNTGPNGEKVKEDL